MSVAKLFFLHLDVCGLRCNFVKRCNFVRRCILLKRIYIRFSGCCAVRLDGWLPTRAPSEPSDATSPDLQIVHQSDFRGEFPSCSGGAAPPATLRIAAARLCDAIPHRAVRLRPTRRCRGRPAKRSKCCGDGATRLKLGLTRKTRDGRGRHRAESAATGRAERFRRLPSAWRTFHAGSLCICINIHYL